MGQMEEIMINTRKFAINVAVAVSMTVMTAPLMAEPWALSTADSDYWSEQQRSRKNLKRIRGLFERLKTSEEDHQKLNSEPTSSEMAINNENLNPSSQTQWTEDESESQMLASQRKMPHYLGSQSEARNSENLFVFGQDDPSVLLPSAEQFSGERSKTSVASIELAPARENYVTHDNLSVEQLQDGNFTTADSAVKADSSSLDVVKVDADSMEYIVQPGDSLRQIARKIYQEPKKWTEIMEWNKLPSHNIFPGQKLKLERVTKQQREDFYLALEQEQRNLFPAQLYRYKVHKVRSGDSLARISKIYLGSQKHYAQLAKLNELDSRRYLKIGQKLIVPIRKGD
tara:strand:+ start:6811 stop:7836 length:1026 start_codon:yes stop_codon:yes gene_type:complete